MSALNNALVIIGILILITAMVLLALTIPMVHYMGYYHCMGMMCGAMLYYPLILPVTLLVIGIILLALPFTLLRMRSTYTSADQNVKAPIIGNMDYLKLLPRQERLVIEYVIKSGGEVYQYQLTRDLGLSKVKAWRIVRRLEEKGLVEVVKVKGRNIIRLRGNALYIK